MEQFAPKSLAEDWDNVGLLVGKRSRQVKKMMTCLTVTPESVAEAIDDSVDLIVSHHPLPFQALQKITSDTTVGQLLLDLIGHSIAVYSPHTGFDSAQNGINQQIAQRIDLQSTRPIVAIPDREDALGSGRIGKLGQPIQLQQLVERVKTAFGLNGMHFVGDPKTECQTIAIACGSGGSFLRDAAKVGADTLISGETNFHTCLEARARKISLVLTGHFFSERFAVEKLADVLSDEFSDVKVWASLRESDPVQWA